MHLRNDDILYITVLLKNQLVFQLLLGYYPNSMFPVRLCIFCAYSPAHPSPCLLPAKQKPWPFHISECASYILPPASALTTAHLGMLSPTSHPRPMVPSVTHSSELSSNAI